MLPIDEKICFERDENSAMDKWPLRCNDSDEYATKSEMTKDFIKEGLMKWEMWDETVPVRKFKYHIKNWKNFQEYQDIEEFFK